MTIIIRTRSKLPRCSETCIVASPAYHTLEAPLTFFPAFTILAACYVTLLTAAQPQCCCTNQAPLYCLSVSLEVQRNGS